MNRKLILLYIENNCIVRKNIAEIIRNSEFDLLETDDISKACEMLRNYSIDMVMINLEPPYKMELDFMQYLHEKLILTPTIITASDIDKETLIDAINLVNVVHFLIKPIDKTEMLDTLHATAKKIFSYHPITFSRLNEGFSYDPINKSINNSDGKSIPLCKKEHCLIELLLTQRGQIVSYGSIEEVLWEDSVMSMDALRTLVRGIRKKTYPSIITNHNGLGYRLEA